MSKKKNPKYVMRQSDLKVIKKEVTNSSMEKAFIIFLTVMTNKWGFGKKRIGRLIGQINELSETINEGYVTFNNLQKALIDEYGIEVKF